MATLERYRPTMTSEVLHSWAADAQAEIERLREAKDCDGCGQDLNAIADAADELERVKREAKVWKQIALFLASCHAATAEWDGQLSGVSKSRKKRYRDICESAFRCITAGVLVGNRSETKDGVLRRLQSVIEKPI